MAVDKKNTTSKLKKMVLLSRIGKTHELRATGIPDDEINKVLANGVTVASGLPGGYVKPSLPTPLWELPGVAEKGPLPPQLLPSPPAVAPAPTAQVRVGVPHITLTTPGSKSLSNRALVLAALSNGTVKLKNLLHSDDTQVMMAALQGLSVRCDIPYALPTYPSNRLLSLSGPTMAKLSSSPDPVASFHFLRRVQNYTSAMLALPHVSSLPSVLSCRLPPTRLRRITPSSRAMRA